MVIKINLYYKCPRCNKDILVKDNFKVIICDICGLFIYKPKKFYNNPELKKKLLKET